MSTKFKNLKNDLQDLESEVEGSDLGASTSSGNSKIANYILLFAFLATLTFYVGNRISEITFENPISGVVQSLNSYDPDLLDRMGSWMEDMGYGQLTHEELTELRNEGVTATYTSQIRDIGYTDITLDQLVELQRADVSATYASMMKQLGYNLTVEELAETRRNGVTANFTSQMMDLGYTLDELTVEKLIGMRSVGVTVNLAKRLIEESGERPTVDELIRYRISNQ